MRVILDTNVVIDWLVFDHPFMAPLRDGVRHKSIRVMRHELTIAELARVLRYPMLKLTEQRCESVVSGYVANTCAAEVPIAFSREDWCLPERFPSCRDRDDDLFLALAFHSRADALVTRDKQLLKMQKRVRRFDVAILDVPHFIDHIKEPAISTC